MKKFLSTLCALCMILTMATPVFAFGLERTDFTQDELNEISRTNQIIEDFLSTGAVTRAGDRLVLPMTVIKQQNNYYCGPATACMVAKTIGLGTYTQSKMARVIGTTEKGSSSESIANGLNDLLTAAKNSNRYQKTNTSKSSLVSSVHYSLQNGFPVIVNVKEMPLYEVGVGHFIAVNGYYAAFAGSSYVNEVSICDPHPDYYGSYQYSMDELAHACESAVGNFCRLA